jgi:ABC-type branched-subunit amino acid transport system substrate-binding protein
MSGCLQAPSATDETTLWNRAFAAHAMAEAFGLDGGKADGETVWIQGFDNAESAAGVQSSVKLFEVSGFKVAGSSSAIPATAPPQDWLPYVNKIMKSVNGGPPQAVFSVMSGKTNMAFYGALRKAGYKGMILDNVSYDPRLLADPQGAQVLEGVYTLTQFEPFESTSPAVQQLEVDVRKIDPKHVFTQATAEGYWAADLFLKALAQAGKDVTPQSFLKAADSMTYDNPGLGKLSFPLNETEPSSCVALVQARGGKYAVAKPLKCFAK